MVNMDFIDMPFALEPADVERRPGREFLEYAKILSAQPYFSASPPASQLFIFSTMKRAKELHPQK